MRRRLLALALLMSLTLAQGAFSADSEDTAEENLLYSDLSEDHTYYDSIYYMTTHGYVQGYDDETFGADEEINRVEALKIIMGSYDYGPATDESIEMTQFPDIDQDSWYYSYLEDAYLRGIVQGHDDGYFRPENTVNRAETLKMIYQMSGQSSLAVETENWYDKYIDFAADNFLILPIEEETSVTTEFGPVETITSLDYLPGNALTRGELCEIIHRHKELAFTGELEYGVASYYGWSFDGANTASGIPLEAYGNMAAHKTLPFGTWVRITNLANNLSVDVEIVDRGPYIEGRIIDLTPGAFEKIGYLSAGVLNTRLEVLK